MSCLKEKAFTLVELAIVIVIIGLLVGGVLQGQELIKQAKIRKDIKRITEINAAIHTFYGKYNFIPGDFPASHAQRFLNLPASRGGNGDGKLTFQAYDSDVHDSDYFWLHLVRAKLLNVISYNCDPFTSTLSPTARFKEGCLSRDGLIYAHTGDLYSNSNYLNYYNITGIGNSITIIGGSTNGHLVTATYSSDVTRSMDEKIDDGIAISGKFRGSSGRKILDINQHTICHDTNGAYLNTDDEISCRILYDFGL